MTTEPAGWRPGWLILAIVIVTTVVLFALAVLAAKTGIQEL